MKTEIIEQGGKTAAYISDSSLIINKVQDALDLMTAPSVAGARKIIIHKENLSPEFFNLASGIAGEILQKFVNYQIQIAIIGDFENVTSKSLRDFIYECNKGNQIFFAKDLNQAKNFIFSL